MKSLTDEELLRECCEPCAHCVNGESGPVSKKIAEALHIPDTGKCPYCNGKGHCCELSAARIRSLMDRVREDEREAQFKDIKRIIAYYHDEHRAKANSDRCSMYGNRADRESWMHTDKANAAEEILNLIAAAIRARSNKGSK